MKKSTENEKEFLKKYGAIINYLDLQEKEVKGLISLVKESEIEQFANYINNKDGKITLKGSTQYGTADINFRGKYESYLKIELCVEGSHFIPYKILKDDILFFFKRRKDNHFFMLVTDECINQILYSEYSIFGIVDFCEGSNLLLEKDSSIKPKMKHFYEAIDKLANEYTDVLFITISDSVLIKRSFKIVGDSGGFEFNNVDFERMIEIFKEIRKIVYEIFNMGAYSVFSYGINKCKTLKSHSENVFHTGILSSEFKEVMEIEKKCRKYKKEEKGDMYISYILYKAFRFYIKKKYLLSTSPFLYPVSVESRIEGEEDVVSLKIP